MRALRVIKVVIAAGLGGAIIGSLAGWSRGITLLLAVTGGAGIGFLTAIYFLAEGLKNENPELMKSIMLAKLMARKGR